MWISLIELYQTFYINFTQVEVLLAWFLSVKSNVHFIYINECLWKVTFVLTVNMYLKLTKETDKNKYLKSVWLSHYVLSPINCFFHLSITLARKTHIKHCMKQITVKTFLSGENYCRCQDMRIRCQCKLVETSRPTISTLIYVWRSGGRVRGGDGGGGGTDWREDIGLGPTPSIRKQYQYGSAVLNTPDTQAIVAV